MSGLPMVGALTDLEIARAANAPGLTVDDFLTAARHCLAQMADEQARDQLEDGIAAITDGEICPDELMGMVDELDSWDLLDEYREER